MLRLFRQFSTPGGIPSHVSAPTPGSIHEGGELGYALGARVRRRVRQPRPDRGVRDRRRRSRDRSARGIVEGRALPQPEARRRGAPDPPSERLKDLRPDRARAHERRGRASACSRSRLRRGVRRGRRPRDDASSSSPATLDDAHTKIREIQATPAQARRAPAGLRSCCARPKDGPALSRRRRAGGGHLPLASGAALERAGQRRAPRNARRLDAQLRARRPLRRERHLLAELKALAPEGDRRMGANPHANGGKVLRAARHARVRRVRGRRPKPGTVRHESTRKLGELMRDIYVRNPDELPAVLPRRDELEPARRGLRGRQPLPRWTRSSRRRPPLARRPGDGGAERAQLRGLARGLCADRPPRPLRDLRGVRDGRRVDGGAAREVARDVPHLPWRAPIPSLNVLLTSTCWRNDHNGFSHQGPGFIDTMHVEAGHRRPRVPAARRELPPVGRRPLLPQPRLREPASSSTSSPSCSGSISTQRDEHCARGASIWDWASSDDPTAIPTSCSRARVTSRRWRRSPRRGSSASSSRPEGAGRERRRPHGARSRGRCTRTA